MTRRAELEANLARLEERVAAACAAAGRERTEVTIVAVTKTFPVEDVRALLELGIHDIGENKDQEASRKAAALREQDAPAVRWHFVGQLQTNKCASVASYADVVHSVDRDRLVAALGAAATEAGRVLDVFVQVALDDAPDHGDRGGAAPEQVLDLAERVAGTSGLHLRGVMAVAPLAASPERAFARLAEVAGNVRAAHPSATDLSAGMSGDLEAAVAYGATHLRIGTALLGGRSVSVR